jgi:hypothetical protein
MMIFAADAFGRGKLAGGAPRKKPSFHILMGDVVPGRYLLGGLADFLLLAICH